MDRRYSLLLGAALCALAMPAAAQTVDANEQEASVDDIIVTGTYTVPDQIDTATGLGLTVQETPQSVTIFTEQRILDQNLDSVADVINNAPGVSFNEIDDVRNTFSARGFEITNYQVDGVPLAWTLAGGAGETIADVSLYERVEIVRGATGLLTGAGDPSASINLVRKHANRRDFGGYVNASYGSWDTYQVTADVGGAVTADGNVRARAVAKYEDGESYIDLYSNQKLVLYGVVDADITDNTLLRVGASHQEGNPNGVAWGALPSFYSDGSFAEWPRSKTASADWTYWDTQNQNIFANVEHTFGNGWVLTFDYNWMRNAQQTELLYLSGTIDTVTTDFQYSYPYKDEGESIQNSYSVRLAGDLDLFGREHEFVLGALHSVQDRDGVSYGALAYPPATDFENWDGAAYPYPGFSETASPAVDETVEQTGYYGALRLNVTDQLKFIGGGRLSSWSLSGYNFGDPREYGDDNVFIPYVGALYDITPAHRLYASYTEIFQPQNSRDRNGDYLDPITGKAYELGLKSRFFDDALQTMFAVFKIEQDNLAQVDVGYTVPDTSPPAQAYYGAQGAVSEGFEFEVVGRPLEGWNINFGYSKFDAEDSTGNPVNTDQPSELLKLFTTYRLTGALENLTIGGGVNYRGHQYSDGLNPVTGDVFRFEQKAYTLVSLMARYDVSDSIQIQANVENLTDETYYSQIGFYSQYRYGAPRNYSVSLNYTF